MGLVPLNHTSSFQCKAKDDKNGIPAETLEPIEVDPCSIYIWNSYHLGNVFQYMYMTTPIFSFISGKKMATNGLWSDKPLE